MAQKISFYIYLNEEIESYLTSYVWPSEPSAINCIPQGSFSFNLRPAEQFFIFMRPLSAFEFETPDLESFSYEMCLEALDNYALHPKFDTQGP